MDSKDYAILLLVGQMTFINQLQRQNHDALRQRIVVNYYLNGLTKDETKEYIISRLAFAGCHEPIFTDDALELLFSCTNGLIRPLNSIARLSLISGAAKQTRSIDSDIVFNAQKEVNLNI
jgi:type II secretory pathway predicted ATPase ExeA